MPRPSSWKWWLCALLFLATMLNYMDRQTLAQLAARISAEYELTNEQYGNLEGGFGWAFAAGGLVFGLIADHASIRWLYPLVLIGWSMAGLATSAADRIGQWALDAAAGIGLVDVTSPDAHPAYWGFLTCRIVLGFFESGQWPCALVTVQRVLAAEQRSLANSILQSGASIGAILTPLVVQASVRDEAGSWRGPFWMIGLVGLMWIVPWFLLVRRGDLTRGVEPNHTLRQGEGTTNLAPLSKTQFWICFAVLGLVSSLINGTWQFFRAWMPKFLHDSHGYADRAVNYFTTAYYISTDLGCLAAGAAVTVLVAWRWRVHRARLTVFFACALLPLLSLLVAQMSAGPALLGLLLLIGFGALAMFPNYYAFNQELSGRHQGKIVGALTAISWAATATMHRYVGRSIDETKSYGIGLSIAGLGPILAWLLMVLFWQTRRKMPHGHRPSD